MQTTEILGLRRRKFAAKFAHATDRDSSIKRFYRSSFTANNCVLMTFVQDYLELWTLDGPGTNV